MRPVADLFSRALRASLDNGEPAFQEKRPLLDTTGESRETTQYSFFSIGLNEIARAPSIQLLKSSCPSFEILMETGMHSGLWWLHVTSPSDEDITTLSRMLDIHPLTIEDIKMCELCEKIELFGPYYFVSLRPPQQPEIAIDTRASSANIYVTVFRESVISFSYNDSPHPAHVWSRIKERQSHLALTSDWICYALIDDIVDGFAPLIDRV